VGCCWLGVLGSTEGFRGLGGLALVWLSPPAAWAQESVREIEEPGTFNKYLTPGVVDRWSFSGKQGELVISSVRTTEFDAILKLVQVIGDDEKILEEIDDDGSNAHLATRLPADAQYKVLVHGYEFKGGGNYRLSLESFPVTPVKIDQPVSETLNEQGISWLCFSAEPDTFVYAGMVGSSPNPLGTAGSALQILDPQGRPVAGWAGLAHLESGGEYYVRVEGSIGQPFELQLNSAGRGPLAIDSDRPETLGPGSALILELPLDGPSFGVIELEVAGDVAAQVVAATQKSTAPNSSAVQPKRDLTFVEIPSKGSFRRYAMIREGAAAYQLRMASQLGGRVQIRYADPRQELSPTASHDGRLPVGSVQFFRLPGAQGRAVNLTCTSSDFDCEVRLYDAAGQVVATDDDGGGGFNAQLRYLPFKTADLMVAVTSRGYGGGGVYQLSSTQKEPLLLETINRIQGTLAAGEVGIFSFQATEEQKVLFHLASEVENAQIRLLNANGVEVQSVRSAKARDVVLVQKFLSAGTWTVLITLPQPGAFQLRAIDGQ
jgi:hypothetical protein